MRAMISLQAFEELPAVIELDARVMVVLEVAEFWRWKQLCDGSREPWYILRKPLPGLPAGTALSLRALHERLFGLTS